MKKLVLTALAVVALSTASFAEFGLGVKLGVGENDPKTLDKMTGDQTTNPGFAGVEFIYEGVPQGWESNKLGVKVGVDFYGKNEVDNAGDITKEISHAVPVSLYYKYDRGVNNFSFLAGMGFTVMLSKIEGPFTNHAEYTLFPHVLLGGEYRFTQAFALGLDLKYNFDAEVKKGPDTYSDRSGLSGALAARFYF